MRALGTVLVLALVVVACGEGADGAVETTSPPEPTTTTEAETVSEEPEEEQPEEAPSASGPVVLDVAVWDDTNTNPPDGRMEIWVRGHGSWFPDQTFGGDSNLLGEFPIGEPGEFYIYPDGRDGVEIRVPFRMTAEMISGSDRDRTQVSIEDSTVTVFGTAIEGLELVFDR